MFCIYYSFDAVTALNIIFYWILLFLPSIMECAFRFTLTIMHNWTDHGFLFWMLIFLSLFIPLATLLSFYPTSTNSS